MLDNVWNVGYDLHLPVLKYSKHNFFIELIGLLVILFQMIHKFESYIDLFLHQ